jgi:hypothetical protein
MKLETFCPLFPGFYGTVFESDESNEIYSYNQENDTDLNYDDFEWDYEDYYDRVASAFVESFEREFNDILPVSITFQKVVSPKYYNFANDTIDIEVEVNLPKLLQLVENNKDNLREYFKQNYTSRSGFISHHSSNIDDWCDPDYIIENPGHRVGALMEALSVLYMNVDDIIYWADSEMYINYEVKEK